MADAALSFVPNLPSTLILWDVDHTLIENGGVSKDTYALAFKLITGNVPSEKPVTHGRTDFQIMWELLEANSVSSDQYKSIAQFKDVLVEAMEQYRLELPKRGYALDGAAETLAALSSVPNIVQSALTGNIAANAYVKLSAFGLERWLDLEVGGYGSDDNVRSNLVGVAQRKVSAKYGIAFDESSTILVGDTPLDVKAAHDGGAKVIAVATGVHCVEELDAAGADVTLKSLGRLDVFVDALTSLRARDVRR